MFYLFTGNGEFSIYACNIFERDENHYEIKSIVFISMFSSK